MREGKRYFERIAHQKFLLPGDVEILEPKVKGAASDQPIVRSSDESYQGIALTPGSCRI